MRNATSRYCISLGVALEAATLKIKELENEIHKKDTGLNELLKQLSPKQMGEPRNITLTADQAFNLLWPDAAFGPRGEPRAIFAAGYNFRGWE